MSKKYLKLCREKIQYIKRAIQERLESNQRAIYNKHSVQYRDGDNT